MQYKQSWTPTPGFSRIAGPGDAGLKQIGFGLLTLQAGESWSLATDDQETALVFLTGAGSVRGKDFTFENIGGRQSVFSGKPTTIYLPASNPCTIEAATALEVAVCQASSERQGPPCAIFPEQVKEVSLGKDNWKRTAYMMVADDVPAHFLFIGEALVPPGNWASFPPHRHDKDDLPYEVDMEEVYYFRFDPPQGFGIQKIYTDSRSIDETITLRQHDTVLIPEGYHPVVSAPGYSMYYLWIMAGANRKFLSRQDPDHRWVAQS
jgi:5-deoxy-glucuronate isomerase